MHKILNTFATKVCDILFNAQVLSLCYRLGHKSYLRRVPTLEEEEDENTCVCTLVHTLLHPPY